MGRVTRPRPRPSRIRSDPARESNRLVREGDHWAFTFAGRTVRVRDLEGIHHLAHLLGEPGREFHVLDLVTLDRGHDVETDRRADDDGRVPDGDAGAMLDDRARTAYRRRLAEIDEDIEDARAAGDIGRAARSEDEREFLVRELSRAFGIGGRSRRAGAASERARVAVTRAVRKAIEQVAEHHDALGDHLRHAVRTGTYCSYEPDPAAPVTWQR